MSKFSILSLFSIYKLYCLLGFDKIMSVKFLKLLLESTCVRN